MPILFQEKPYAVAVLDEYWGGKVCFSCLRETSTHRCAGCGEAWYCSTACQTHDWRTGQHSRECAVFAKVKSRLVWAELKGDEGVRLAARLLGRRAVDGGSGLSTDVIGAFPGDVRRRHLDELLARKATVRGANAGRFAASRLLFERTFAREKGFFAQVDERELALTYALFCTNGLTIEDKRVFEFRTLDRGVGVYLQMSRFNHACDADLLVFTGASATMSVKTQRDGLDAKPFDQLTIGYCEMQPPALVTTADFRRPLIQNRFQFKCACALCRDKKGDLIKKWSVALDCPKCADTMIIKPQQRDIKEKQNKAKCLTCKKYYRISVNQFKATTQFWEMYYKDEKNFPTVLLPRIAEILHPIKNLKLMELRFQSGNVLEGEKILEQYDHYGVKSAGYPILCAQLARIYEKAEEFDGARHMYERAMKLWTRIYTSDCRCVKAIAHILRRRLTAGEKDAAERMAAERRAKQQLDRLVATEGGVDEAAEQPVGAADDGATDDAFAWPDEGADDESNWHLPTMPASRQQLPADNGDASGGDSSD